MTGKETNQLQIEQSEQTRLQIQKITASAPAPKPEENLTIIMGSIGIENNPSNIAPLCAFDCSAQSKVPINC